MPSSQLPCTRAGRSRSTAKPVRTDAACMPQSQLGRHAGIQAHLVASKPDRGCFVHFLLPPPYQTIFAGNIQLPIRSLRPRDHYGICPTMFRFCPTISLFQTFDFPQHFRFSQPTILDLSKHFQIVPGVFRIYHIFLNFTQNPDCTDIFSEFTNHFQNLSTSCRIYSHFSEFTPLFC